MLGIGIVYFSGGFNAPIPSKQSTTSEHCIIYQTTTLNSTSNTTILKAVTLNGTELINTYDQFGNYFASSCINPTQFTPNVNSTNEQIP